MNTKGTIIITIGMLILFIISTVLNIINRVKFRKKIRELLTNGYTIEQKKDVCVSELLEKTKIDIENGFEINWKYTPNIYSVNDAGKTIRIYHKYRY